MPDFPTRARSTLTMREDVVSGPQYAFHTINPATLPSYPAATDTIRFMTLPAGARIIDATLRVSGNIAAASSTLTLQQLVNTTATSLTAALAATAAGSVRMNVAPPAGVSGHPVHVQALVSTAALNASGDIEVYVEYLLPEQL